MTEEVDLPTIEDEVTRKALAEVKRLLEDYTFKRISKRELELCLASVWNCVSGCTREAFHEVTAAASSHLARLPPDEPLFDLLSNGKAFVLVQSKPGLENCHVWYLVNGQSAWKPYDCSKEEHPYRMAAQKRQHIAETLQVSGYTKLSSIL